MRPSSPLNATIVPHNNRPLTLRGHVTNASFKQWDGILLMPKLERAQKNYLYTPILRGNPFKGNILWHFEFFNKVVWFAFAAKLKGILLPSNMAARTTFCLYTIYLIVALRCALNVTTSSFQHFPVKFKCKMFVLKDVILNFRNHILVTWPAMILLII